MLFSRPLVRGVLLRRYKRFLADVTLPDGSEVTVHAANPGAMTGLAEPGMTVWLEPNDDPKRKLRWSWKLVETPVRGDGPGGLACIDTGLANRIVGEALTAGGAIGFEGYDKVRPEVRYGDGSRADFLLEGEGRPILWLEVKSVTLSRERGLAEFPDTVTKRGAKHLDELAAQARGGARAAMLYLVQRSDCDRAALAPDIDPAYAAAFEHAAAAGVEAMAFACDLSREGAALGRPLPFVPPGAG